MLYENGNFSFPLIPSKIDRLGTFTSIECVSCKACNAQNVCGCCTYFFHFSLLISNFNASNELDAVWWTRMNEKTRSNDRKIMQSTIIRMKLYFFFSLQLASHWKGGPIHFSLTLTFKCFYFSFSIFTAHFKVRCLSHSNIILQCNAFDFICGITHLLLSAFR